MNFAVKNAMFNLNENNRFVMDQHPSDMRIGVNGMCGQVRAVGLDPTNGDVYIFVGSSRKIMKLLHWERGGFAMYYKRLEQGRFPRAKAAKATPGSSWTACATTLPLTKSDRCCLITTRNRKDNPLRFLFFRPCQVGLFRMVTINKARLHSRVQAGFL